MNETYWRLLEDEQPQDMDAVFLDCGRHYKADGTGGHCHKCAYFNSDDYQRRASRGLQYRGDSWEALLHPTEKIPAIPDDGVDYRKERNHRLIEQAKSEPDSVMTYALLMNAYVDELKRLRVKIIKFPGRLQSARTGDDGQIDPHSRNG